jgi:hypothetical protein
MVMIKKILTFLAIIAAIGCFVLALWLACTPNAESNDYATSSESMDEERYTSDTLCYFRYGLPEDIQISHDGSFRLTTATEDMRLEIETLRDAVMSLAGSQMKLCNVVMDLNNRNLILHGKIISLKQFMTERNTAQ